MQQASLDNMPTALKEAYLKVAPSPTGLQTMHDRDAKRMVQFEDIADDKIKPVKVPVLIIIGENDIILPAHALEMQQLIMGSELAILPGGHGGYIGEITTLLTPGFKESNMAVPMEKFLDRER